VAKYTDTTRCKLTFSVGISAVAILLPFLLAGCGSTGVVAGGGNQPTQSGNSISVAVTPASLSFGNVTVGSTSTKTVLVTNTGNADLVISAVAVTGAGFGLNSVSFPLTITAGSSYTASLTFSPQTAGSSSGTATISSNAATSPTSVSFDGNGVSSPAPAMSVSPVSLSFGNIVVATSSTKTVAITNTGTADLIISAINVSGNGFSVTPTTFPLTVKAGATYTASFVFSPNSAGAVSGAASIVSNAGGSAPVVSLAGSGVTAPVGTLSVFPNSVAFGNVTVGATSSKNVVLSNTGNANVVVSSATVTGSAFTINGTTPVTIAPGASSTWSVSFAPQAAGAASGNASFVSNASNPNTAVSLAGSGVTATAHNVDLTWVASTSVVSGYNVYRGSQTGGPYQRVNTTLLSAFGYTDSAVASGQNYFYVVTAMDSAGNESGFSNEAVAVIP
jgi:hypothetical protein